MSSLILGKSEEPNPQDNTSCYECLSGRFHLRHITYFTWLNEELVTVPNFPAWVCDICGRTEFDNQAVTVLNTLLKPGTGRKRFVEIKTKEQPYNQTRT